MVLDTKYRRYGNLEDKYLEDFLGNLEDFLRNLEDIFRNLEEGVKS